VKRWAVALVVLAACGGGGTGQPGRDGGGGRDGARGDTVSRPATVTTFVGGSTLYNPSGVAVDTAGNLYVADYGNQKVRKVDPTGAVTTLAGNGTAGFFDGTGGDTGTTEFFDPTSVAVDTAGNVYVTDVMNSRIRKIAPSGATTTLAGNGSGGYFDGTGGPTGSTQFWFVCGAGVAVDTAGNVYVADCSNRRVRKLDPTGATTTLAGNGVMGWVDGTGGPTGTAEFIGPLGVAVDTAGNVYVSDVTRIRKLDPTGATSTLTGNNSLGFVDGTGGPTGTTELYQPDGLAVDAAGFVYVADTHNERIRKVAPSGATSTLAGNGMTGSADGTGGPGGTAQFYNPLGVAVDTAGIVYVADTANNAIRKITP
jgi:sugar lactone lactonase YvrE